MTPADDGLFFLGTPCDDVEQLLCLLLDAAATDDHAEHLESENVDFVEIEGGPLGAVRCEHVGEIARVLVFEDTASLADVFLLLVVAFSLGFDLLVGFFEHTVYLEHFQKG